MADIRERKILEKRLNIDGGAWVSREGQSIKISYDFAGRVTKPNQIFYVDDILALAQFVRETDELKDDEAARTTGGQ